MVAWVLIVGFLLQPVLGYLVTPVIVHDKHGQQIVICTLQGEKRITVDIPELATPQDAEHCTALKLFQMAGTTPIAEPPTVPEAVLYAISMLEQTAEHQHRFLHFSAYSTRAPPIV
jgi:hypothetical protein